MARANRLEATVREQVRIELAVRRELDAASRTDEKLLFRILKHPLALLVIGSLLTAVVGSFFAAQWQLREWKIQQEHQLEIEEAKEMRLLQIEAAQALSETFGAAQDVLHLWEWTWPKDSAITEFSDRGERWVRSSRKWRTAENVLHARVRSRFGPKVAKEFSDLADRRRTVGNAIINVLAIADRARAGPMTVKDRVDFDTNYTLAKNMVAEVMVAPNTLQHLMQSMEEAIEHRERERRNSKPNIIEWWPMRGGDAHAQNRIVTVRP